MEQGQNYQHHRPEPSSASPLQPTDSTPQDVLAEARKNLQVLIDSGLSKDLLHQWVDDSQSLQLSFSSPTPSPASSQLQSQQLVAERPPSPPPCPSPPPHLASGTSAAGRTPTLAVTGPPARSPSSPSGNVKLEPLPDDVSERWSSAHLAVNAPSESRASSTVGDADGSIFAPPSAPFSHSHHPRISVSSVSSGSSGHASIWSTNSAQSSFSWNSGTTGGRSMAPLPIPPTTSGLPVLNGTHGPATAVGPSRQNIYWCTSCETSFKRKYDWKRHEDEFHERWRKYPCPEPGCNRSFWGSNSFNQHHKQCHGCTTCPHAEKVVKFLRKRKYWACGFCSALHPARERHVEHVARHFESGLTKGDWMHSRVVYGLLHQPLIHEAWDALVGGKQGEYSGRRPQFSWHPSKTGRAQGFLEKENNGQLQDLLEFFSGNEEEARWIAGSAYDLADVVLTLQASASPQFSAVAAMPSQQFSPQDAPPQFQLPALPSQQPMLSSPRLSGQGPFAPPFRGTMFVPSQQFAAVARPSPDSAAHSPLTASQSPLAATHSPMEHQKPPQLASSSAASSDSMMDFEYSPTPVVFEDWESLAGAVIHSDPSTQPSQGTEVDWNILQYFGDPGVLS
ncbi:zinc finger domain-containing protein [Drechmeria coniospora]|uniref:Zinc finger domain-containing protein n=1 Tax=Drechmeria coniospora TaxID=98403 RepID=A0A151GNZ4_DRECN|nr:zinc finger domain-containing protein [Drechmeria coniospora]KYK58829.1 zinc finger domain-containing protein [Drechmeria coniospora]ODA84197.1 hypothetical protein RJ55_02715 [Drechmeria coniospora]